MSAAIFDPLAQKVGRGLPILGSGCSHPAALVSPRYLIQVVQDRNDSAAVRAQDRITRASEASH